MEERLLFSGHIEKWGLGIGKILKLEPNTEFEESGAFFIATFKRKNIPKNSERTTRKTTKKTTKKIITLIKDNKNISSRELVEKVGN